MKRLVEWIRKVFPVPTEPDFLAQEAGAEPTRVKIDTHELEAEELEAEGTYAIRCLTHGWTTAGDLDGVTFTLGVHLRWP